MRKKSMGKSKSSATKAKTSRRIPLESKFNAESERNAVVYQDGTKRLHPEIEKLIRIKDALKFS